MLFYPVFFSISFIFSADVEIDVGIEISSLLYEVLKFTLMQQTI